MTIEEDEELKKLIVKGNELVNEYNRIRNTWTKPMEVFFFHSRNRVTFLTTTGKEKIIPKSMLQNYVAHMQTDIDLFNFHNKGQR